MNKYIEEILNTLEMENYYLKRPTKLRNCIVYNYNEFTRHKADGKETHSKFDCYFNLIIDNNISKNIKRVKTLLLEKGFKKIVINNPYEITDGFYEVTMNFTKIMESEE